MPLNMIHIRYDSIGFGKIWLGIRKITKICAECHIERSTDEFSKRRKYGFYSYCKDCRRKFTKKWIEDNPDEWKSTLSRYRESHLEQERAKSRKWHKDNPGKSNRNTSKRRAAKINRSPSWLNAEQLEEIQWFYIAAKELQWLSDPTDPLEVDHIVPLQGKNVSGLHVPWNLQILPKSLNLKKGNRL